MASISESQKSSITILSFTTNDQRVAIWKSQLPASRQGVMSTNEVVKKDRSEGVEMFQLKR